MRPAEMLAKIEKRGNAMRDAARVLLDIRRGEAASGGMSDREFEARKQLNAEMVEWDKRLWRATENADQAEEETAVPIPLGAAFRPGRFGTEQEARAKYPPNCPRCVWLPSLGLVRCFTCALKAMTENDRG